MPKIVSENGTIRARIITPGHGSSGYYSPSMLEKAAPKFDGAQVFWDHPTSTEESIRPERSLRDLAGKIQPGTAKWEAQGRDGAGIYADVSVFKPYHEAVNELGPHIGMSIRASGVGKKGNVDGKDTLVIESIDAVQSVDFVTLPGRGGKILQMFEAARPKTLTESGQTPLIPTQEAAMDAAELTKLQESIATANAAAATANAANAKLLERALRGDAREVAARILAGITLPEASRARVIDSVLREALPKTEAGELDTVKFTEAVNAEAKREGAYVGGLIGSGQVTGMGPVGEATPVREAEKPEEINARAVKIFERLGHSKEAAALAVKGRVA